MAKKNFSAQVTIGGALASSFKSAISQAKSSFGEVGSAIKQLESRNKELNSTIKSQEKLGAAGSALRVSYAQQEIAVIGSQIAALKERDRIMQKGLARRDAGRDMMMGGGLMIGGALAAAATLGKPIKLAADFETAMSGIAKQVQGARDDAGNLTSTYFEMGEAIKKLSRESPINQVDVANMVTSAARMGVAKEDLIDFTKTAIEMATAFEVKDPAELAEAMGKIATLYKIPNTELRKLGDTINWLDDQALAKAPEIIDFMKRVGGVAGSIKISADQMATLGSTLLSLGETPQTAGTAVNAMAQKFAAATKGGKKFREAMAELGLSTEAVQKGMQIDAQGTLLKVISAINKLPADKRLGVGVDLVGLEHSDTLAKLVSGVDEYRKQIEVAKHGAGSMSKEYQEALKTLNKQMQMLGNTAKEAGIDIGGVLIPTMKKLVGEVKAATGGIADYSKENPVMVENILSTTAAIVGLTAALGIGRLAAGGFMFAWGAIPPILAAGRVAIGATMIAINGMRAALLGLGPVGWGLLGAGLIASNWDSLTGGEKSGPTATWDDTELAMGGYGGGLPQPAMRGASSNVTNHVTAPVTFTVNAAPGQDEKAIARSVMVEIDRQKGIQRRSVMFDRAMGY